MTDQTNDHADTAAALAELAAAAGIDPADVAGLLCAMHARTDRQLREPANRVHADRARYRRPGPKNPRQELARRRVPAGTRLAGLPAHIVALDLPARLPTDPPVAVHDHPFGFRPLFYFPDGRPVPTEPEADYFAAIAAIGRARRVATTGLYHRGAHLRVSTAFLGHDVRDASPPRLWETMVFLGRGRRGGAGIEAAGWTYTSAAAARHGHATVVAALRAAQAAGRPPARRRAPTAPGPWRAGYPARWR